VPEHVQQLQQSIRQLQVEKAALMQETSNKKHKDRITEIEKELVDVQSLHDTKKEIWEHDRELFTK
jgi:uncharacterized protein YigA (DUF484 family)